VIFAEFYGPPTLFAETVSQIEARIATVLRVRPDDVVIRRVETESDYSGAEVWIELSSQEQLARHGRDLASGVTSVIRSVVQADVWVLFRIVPLEYVYLNGEPRQRGGSALT
jgi:hypothetical protein